MPSRIKPGDTFGRLTVVKKEAVSKDRHIVWGCVCQCGNSVSVPSNRLTTGNTKSCGCLVRDMKTGTKHGGCGTRLYRIWHTMRARCKYDSHIESANYKQRNIAVCHDWNNSFENFRRWAIDAGYKETLTLDRIDVNGNYEPQNCRWVSYKTQNNNKRNNRVLTINGESKTVTQWSEISGVNRYTIYKRLNRGVNPEAAVFDKPKTRGDKI